MSRVMRVVVAIGAVQATLMGLYWLVERERPSPERPSPALSTAPPQQVNGRAPPLSLERPDASHIELGVRHRPTLVHFWATWCPPCRDELPGLLALQEKRGVDVLAIALDGDWAVVETFLDGEPEADVVLGDARKVEQALGVRSLPVTFVMGPDARFRFRFDGARDWTDPRFLDTWLPEVKHD